MLAACNVVKLVTEKSVARHAWQVQHNRRARHCAQQYRRAERPFVFAGANQIRSGCCFWKASVHHGFGFTGSEPRFKQRCEWLGFSRGLNRGRSPEGETKGHSNRDGKFIFRQRLESSLT